MRVFGLAYIGLNGPVYAEELEAYVASTPGAMQFFCLSVLACLLALSIVFQPSRLQKALATCSILPRKGITLGDIVFIAAAAFSLLLYADMFRRGVIPLFQNMERFDYTRQYAGYLHQMLFQLGFLYAVTLGAFFVYPRLIGQGYDYRFIGLLAILFAYCVLTGHRFSAFFSFGSFFLIPLASVFALKSVNALPALPLARTPLQKILQSKLTWAVCGALLMLVIAAVMYHSLTNVRNYDAPAAKLAQRILVQPIQMWLVTWDNVIGKNEWAPSAAWELMFQNPLDADRNTGIQFLMLRALGIERTAELLSLGNQYAGGYPEVLVELAGPYAALPVAFGFCLITALLLRLIVVSVCRGNFGTMFMAVYVFYGFSLLFIGGMLNFLFVETFAVKVLVLFVIYWLEMKYYRLGKRLIPWVIFNYSKKGVALAQ